MAKKRYPVVEVEWIDSATCGGWMEPADYVDKAPVACRTAGYLFASKRGHLIIVQSVDDANGKVTDSMTIPRSCVRSIKRFR